MRKIIYSSALLMVTRIAIAQVSPELVMREGTRIEATKDGSTISVTAGKGYDRVYESNGCKLKSNMNARGGRWFGKLGIYDPAGSMGWSFFAPASCNGITRTVVDEAQIHFDDMQFLYEWIRRQQLAYSGTGRTVWTNSGLLFSWNTVPGRSQLNADVYQICIHGSRPKNLNGATDGAIKVVGSSLNPLHECVTVGKDVIDQSRKQLEDDWKQVDGWIAESKARRERAEKSTKSN